MRHLCSAVLAIAISVLPITSHAVAVIGNPTVVLTTIADPSTPIPGGSGAFTGYFPADPSHPPDPCISAGNIAFWATAPRAKTRAIPSA